MGDHRMRGHRSRDSSIANTTYAIKNLPLSTAMASPGGPCGIGRATLPGIGQALGYSKAFSTPRRVAWNGLWIRCARLILISTLLERLHIRFALGLFPSIRHAEVAHTHCLEDDAGRRYLLSPSAFRIDRVTPISLPYTFRRTTRLAYALGPGEAALRLL